MSRLAALIATLLLLSTGATTAHAAQGWTWPLLPEHQVTRPFGLGPTVYAAGHRGADLAGEPGQRVLAAGAGRVTYAGSLAGRGVVTVTHGALRTTYEPVTATVRVGALLGVGDAVGTLEAGHEGCPASACLHWGLRRGDVYLDPLRLVQQGPVRLLTPDSDGLPGRVAGASLAGARLPVREPRPRSAQVKAAARTPTVGPEDPGRRRGAVWATGAAVVLVAGTSLVGRGGIGASTVGASTVGARTVGARTLEANGTRRRRDRSPPLG